MRSTRSKLIVYFLALLGLGLGVIALLADRVVFKALRDKELAAAEALDLRTTDHIKNENDKFNRELLTHAQLIGRDARTEYLPQSDLERHRFHLQLWPTYLSGGFTPTTGLWLAGWHTGLFPQQQQRRGGSSGSGPPPSLYWSLYRSYSSSRFNLQLWPSYLASGVNPTSPLWLASWHSSLVASPRRGSPQGPPPPSLYWLLYRSYSSNLSLDELYLKHLDDDERPQDFVQINGILGSVPRSPNLSSAGYFLPFDRNRFEKVWDDWVFDDVKLPGENHGRRVTFRTPLPIFGPSFGGRQPNPPRPAATDPSQYIFIQVARPSTELDRRVTEFHHEADQEKLILHERTRRTIGWTRAAIGFTAVLTFLACLLGSSWFVRRGLTPLNRLSDAVSHVSERDFRLGVDREELTTELQPIHARITETLDQLKHAFDREKQAVADISHELRTPVASLLATIDVSLRKPRSADQYHQTLQDCRGITKQLGQLVERVMTLAYLDAGQTKVSFVPTDADEIAASCAAVIRPLAEAHGLTFELKAACPVEIRTDPDKLREVLINLLHNAVEYNRPGGRIELDVTADAENVRFRVRDTGIGMTPEVRDKIFERFFRADPSRTATGVHAGLGLAIVKEYVDRLGGSITVESVPDVGSTFCVTLPAA